MARRQRKIERLKAMQQAATGRQDAAYRVYGPEQDAHIARFTVLDGVIGNPRRLHTVTLCTAEQFDHIPYGYATQVIRFRSLTRKSLMACQPACRMALEYRRSRLTRLRFFCPRGARPHQPVLFHHLVYGAPAYVFASRCPGDPSRPRTAAAALGRHQPDLHVGYRLGGGSASPAGRWQRAGTPVPGPEASHVACADIRAFRYRGVGSSLPYLANDLLGFIIVQLGPHRPSPVVQPNGVSQSAPDPGRT